ncbi:MAG: phospholipase D-like domain-containing protein [Chloroflexi bacterium]|nr:phospholipase D-like domain-containing protein [Chloroflexota bacterium]
MQDLFGNIGGEGNQEQVQAGFALDDGTGLRVVKARFVDEAKFDWQLFQGFDSIRVLTYSASIPAIVKMLDEFGFDSFECVFGCEATLRGIKDVLAFQRVAVGDARAAIMGLTDQRHAHILSQVQVGKASFRVLRNQVAHAKLYLLENRSNGSRRVVVGSANLSERAFSGRQPETLVTFDDDPEAWEHYSQMYRTIRDSASDEIPLPAERIINAEIEIEEVPAVSDHTSTLVIDRPADGDGISSFPIQVERIERVAAAISPHVAAAAPPFRNGKQQITPQIKREISRIKLVKSAEESDNRYFSLKRAEEKAILSGEEFLLDWDQDKVSTDAKLMLEYFNNYEGAFEGDVSRLQRDYFTLWSWFYFSPFICDMRSRALLLGEDVVRYPSFAIVFGKSNCGKTTLVDTLMTSMFGKSTPVDKSSFTNRQLRSLQQAYRRYPVVFDDIGRNAFSRHGRDIIKDELPPPVEEYPGFVLSMNAEPTAFPDEIVKRSLMIYTTTALPPHQEELRQRLHSRIQGVREGLTGHLYRRYLAETMECLKEDSLPKDWLYLSSGVLSGILNECGGESSTPQWCQGQTWLGYAEKRYDRVRARLDDLLRASALMKREGETPNGWLIDGQRVIVLEQRDAFGRRGFDWEDVPSTLIDEDASGGARTVLHRASLEGFLGRSLAPRRRMFFWKK